MYTNCHSYYSLQYGTFSEVSLLELAEKNQILYLALTDINSTTALLNFLQEAPHYKVWPVVGVDFRNGVQQCFVLLAKTNLGFQLINEYLTQHLHQKKPFPTEAPILEDTYVIYPFELILEQEKTNFRENEFIGVSIKNLNRLPFTKYKSFNDQLVIQQTVTFRSQNDYNTHKLLRCIGLNILGSKLEDTEKAASTDCMVHKEVLLEKFSEYPNIQENTKQIMQSCKVNFFFDDQKTNQNQEVYFNSKEEDYAYLRKRCYEQLPNRYPVITEEIEDRIEKELNALNKMNYLSYFLINLDIIDYARSKGYPHIGRGSGANSVVAYILGITNVDAIELDLYFERFVNVFRNSPPDFDIDFSWRDREDMTRYIFERFKNVALMGTYVTYQYRSIVRELGKVFGVPKYELDEYLEGRRSAESSDHNYKLIEKYGKLIHGLPNFVSVHSCGIVITKKPISYYSATFMPPKGFQTLFFDMNIAEDIGIYKFDILAQRGLSKIVDTVEIVKYNQPDAHIEDLEKVYRFKEDPVLNDLLKVGDCMGVFYVESPAMRGLMTKLQTQDYLNLVAASSIIRPGVSNGGMKNQYILRHRYPEKRKEAHPIMLKILDDTYGVMVYQEDVLKVAHKFAGLSLAEADILRRGMRGKTRSKEEFAKIEAKFKSNCKVQGYSDMDTEDIWHQIRAFAGYAFAKGHSASYAVESYQSLYLKKYFPLEFMVSVLNNGGGFYNIETYVHEIFQCGGTVVMPCINTSDHPNLIFGKKVFLGFGMIKDLEHRTIEKILTNRQLHGFFIDFDDFEQRIPLGIEQLTTLIRANMFRFLGIDKHVLMWKAHLKLSKRVKGHVQPKLFVEKPVDYTIPKITTSMLIEAYDQMELLGFPLISRFKLLKEPMLASIYAEDFTRFKNRKIIIYGKLITAKGTPTKDKRLMHFGTFVDIKGKIFDTVHFPGISEKYPIKTKGIYKIIGIIKVEMDYYSVTVQEAHFQTVQRDPRHHSAENAAKNIIN